jgi:hypothetical protein
MKLYQYFSNGYNSNVTLGYRDGLLALVEVDSPIKLPDDHMSYFYSNEQGFLNSVQKHKIPFSELTREITFEIFWEKYAYKVGKAEAFEQWKKLSKVDQQAAYYFIPQYNARLKLSNEARRHPATYLHKKTWR